MKRISLMLAPLALALFVAPLTACGTSFKADDLDAVKKYVLEDRNYTVKLDETNTIYVTDEFIGREMPSGYLIYTTTVLEASSNPHIIAYTTSSSKAGYSSQQNVSVENQADVYNKYSLCTYFDLNWKYDEATASYTCNDGTLKIDGKEVTITVTITYDEGEEETMTYVYYDFGKTKFSYSV